MGPQLDSCGRRRAAPLAALRKRLQWGRNLTVAEGSSGGAAVAADEASMGPQLDSCGRVCFMPPARLRRHSFNGAAT